MSPPFHPSTEKVPSLGGLLISHCRDRDHFHLAMQSKTQLQDFITGCSNIRLRHPQDEKLSDLLKGNTLRNHLFWIAPCQPYLYWLLHLRLCWAWQVLFAELASLVPHSVPVQQIELRLIVLLAKNASDLPAPRGRPPDLSDIDWHPSPSSASTGTSLSKSLLRGAST